MCLEISLRKERMKSLELSSLELTHHRIAMYCKWFMPTMEIVIDLVRASFIRPKEISLIQIKEIDLFKKSDFYPGFKIKNTP